MNITAIQAQIATKYKADEVKLGSLIANAGTLTILLTDVTQPDCLLYCLAYGANY